jgi:hypothetical protein
LRAASSTPPSAACAPRPDALARPGPDHLIGELSLRSQPFRERRAAHDVAYYRSGLQPFRHPLAGDRDLEYDALEIPADPGQTIIAYSAEPGSAAHQALGILPSWARHPPQAASSIRPTPRTDTRPVELEVRALRRTRHEARLRGWLEVLPGEVVHVRPVFSPYFAGVLVTLVAGNL